MIFLNGTPPAFHLSTGIFNHEPKRKLENQTWRPGIRGIFTARLKLSAKKPHKITAAINTNNSKQARGNMISVSFQQPIFHHHEPQFPPQSLSQFLTQCLKECLFRNRGKCAPLLVMPSLVLVCIRNINKRCQD